MSTNQEKLILLTHADPFQQRLLNIDYKTLERSLKNSILLFGKVTMPGSCILKGENTFKLVKVAKELLREGLIVPDLREEYKGYNQYLEKNKANFAHIKEADERASFLDKHATNVISFLAPAVSSDLENNLISSLFFLKLNGDIKIKWKDFHGFADVIKKPGISDRQQIFDALHKIASPEKLVHNTIQAIYHTLGALVTTSNPVWPQVYTETYSTIRAAQENVLPKIEKSKEAAAFKKKFKFVGDVQELHYEYNKIVPLESLHELENLSFISEEVLDNLEWQDILDLSTSKTARTARNNLFKESTYSNFVDLNALIKKEHKNKTHIEKSTKGLLVASIVSGSVSLVPNPAIASAGMGLSIAGLLFTFADMYLKGKASRHLKGYTMLGEKITETAEKNKHAERLKRI